MELETTSVVNKICGTRSAQSIHIEKKVLQKNNAFSLLKSPPLRTRKTKTENRRQSLVELVVCDLQVLNSALRCPYKPFKLGLGGKQVTRYTREKHYGILSCFSIIIIFINSSLYFNVIRLSAKSENNIMNIRNISAQINEIVEAVLPLQKSSAALHDSILSHTHTHTRHSFVLMDITHKALRASD